MQQDITQLVGQAESEQLEYKAVLPPARSLAQIIASFANTSGGVIILGIAANNGDIIVNGLSEDFQANSVTHKAIDLLTPKPQVNYDYFTYQGKRLYVIETGQFNGRVLFEGKNFIRKDGRITNADAPTPGSIRTLFIQSFETVLKALYTNSTGSKIRLLDHYNGVLNIMAELSNQLYPASPAQATTQAEGKILSRILFSSCADNFETYLSDLLYEIYLANPSTLKSGQQVSVKEVLDCTDMQEFVLYIAKKKLGKLLRGSIRGFTTDNAHIKNLGVLGQAEENDIEKILQIRHLYAHRNGVVDEKFLQFYPGSFNINDEHQLTAQEIVDYMRYLANITDQLDKAAVQTYNLATLQ